MSPWDIQYPGAGSLATAWAEPLRSGIPHTTYTESGVFDVTLTIVNPLGQPNTIKKLGYIDTNPVPFDADATCFVHPVNNQYVNSLSANAPVLGQTWMGQIDVTQHDAIPGANPVKNIALLWGYEYQAIPVPATYSFCTALVVNDLQEVQGCSFCVTTGMATLSFPVPNDGALIGRELYAQAFAQHSTGPVFNPNLSRPSFSNTMKLTLGTFDPDAGALFGCGTPAIAPGCVFADFTYTQAAPGAPVAFMDTSTGPGTISSWSWDFGDNTTSTLQNPTHTYSLPGTYDVTLMASNMFDGDTTVLPVNVN